MTAPIILQWFFQEYNHEIAFASHRMFEQLNKFYVKFKLTVNDSCEIWILHSLNSWYHHSGAVEFSLQTLEKINYPLHFEMSMIILARLKSPFGRPKEPNQKKQHSLN